MAAISTKGSPINVVPFRAEFVEDAVDLFAARYREVRARLPALPSCHADGSTVRPRLLDLLGKAPGVAAVQDGRLLGYLIGQPIPTFKSAERGVFAPIWAHGARGDARRAIYEHMYEQLSRLWVAAGCMAQAISLYAEDSEVVDVWFRDGFGLLVVDAVRTLDPVPVHNDPGVTVRAATVDDVDRLMPLVSGLSRYLAGGPIFLPMLRQPSAIAYAAFIAEPGQTLWLALVGDELVGYFRTQPPQADVALVVHDSGTIAITGAFVAPEWRRHGVASALLRHVVEWARVDGYERCSVDFESQNLYGGRFWLAHFQPVCHSLLRRIDERIAWAYPDRPLEAIW
jgi:GNAT superfamily N-acetyltransferase